jgi:hypothetical protein
MSYRTKTLTCLLALCIVGLPLARGAELRSSSNKKMLKVRLIGSEPSVPTTSFGPNWKSYVAEVQSGAERPRLVRFVYRYALSAPTMPGTFLDYALVHRFRALRDEACDMPLASMLYSYKFSSGDFEPVRPTGRELTLEYASSAPRLSAADPAVLPCYVVGPKDYKGSRASQPVEEYSKKSVDELEERTIFSH